MDTVFSDEMDEIDELIDELSNDNMDCLTPTALYSESSTSTPDSILYSNYNLEFARFVNDDLALNNLTTSSTPDKIWSSLHKRCVDKFGDQNFIKNNASVNNILWACVTLPAYLRWNTMV